MSPMTSETTEVFRNRLRELPNEVRALARRTYARWQSDSHHPSLQFKRVLRASQSIRSGLGFTGAPFAYSKTMPPSGSGSAHMLSMIR
jgi:hypothetical protein